MKRMIWIVLAIILVSIPAAADVVTLKSGEQLIGTWENVEGGNLTFKSDTLGEVTIPLAKVKSMSYGAGVIVEKNKSTVRGRLELLPSGDWQVTSAGQSQTIPAASVEAAMPVSTFNALEEHQAKLWQDWKGNANFGYNLQRGDQQTGTISANVAATRERPEAPIFLRHWRTNYSLLMLFAKAQQDGSIIRSNTISTAIREDYLLSPSDFLFVIAQLDHVQAQGVYLRQTYGGGFGHDLVHTARTTFTVIGGLTFVNLRFYTGGPAQQSAEALAGEKLNVQVSKRIVFSHYLNFYPNLTSTGEYRFDTTSSLGIKLTSRFSANVSLVDLYLSNPTPGNHKNNVAFTTGLGVVF
ncbi:MAG: DUF481 domain-containing protein [Terriglobia bacterium]